MLKLFSSESVSISKDFLHLDLVFFVRFLVFSSFSFFMALVAPNFFNNSLDCIFILTFSFSNYFDLFFASASCNILFFGVEVKTSERFISLVFAFKTALLVGGNGTNSLNVSLVAEVIPVEAVATRFCWCAWRVHCFLQQEVPTNALYTHCLN